jgi:ketosteroid isomerase-like protein
MTTTIDVRADIAADVIALERAALDRWGQGDPSAYEALFDPAITYFDPFQARRLDGIAAMQSLFAQIAGKIRVDRYDMQRPVVQRDGDVALLSFNLVSYRTDDGPERVISSWNSTEAYRRTPQGWRIFHSHWSFVQPELKKAVSDEW